jgi:magnesium transporter
MAQTELAEVLDSAFHKQTAEICLSNLAKIASEYSPIDLALAVSNLPLNVRPVLFENLDSLEKKIQFLTNTDRATRVDIFRFMNDMETKALLEEAPADEAVYMLEDLSEKRFRRLMDLIEINKASRIRALKQHHLNSAGRLMTNEFFAFTGEMTVGDASAAIRDNPGIDFTRRLFVVDPQGQIRGYVPARNLIVNPYKTSLASIMLPCRHSVSPEATREEVVDIVERYKISGLPVIDDREQLIGVITYDDTLEAMEDMTDETIAAMGGTGESVSENEPFFMRFFARAPWLFVTLIAGLLNMCVMTLFKEYDRGLLTFVFFFVPLITGMSGNIGLQCSTVLVRNMALGMITKANRREIIFKELALGLFAGASFGLISAIFVYVLNTQGVQVTQAGPLAVGLIVGVGLCGSCISGTLLGVFSPFLFSRIGIDPAVSAGPIITALNDFLSMSIYFLIAAGLTSFFLA